MIEIVGVTLFVTVIVTVFDVTGVVLVHCAFDVNTHVIVLPFVNAASV